MRPLAVHHVSINVNDVEAALAFYCDTLGLVPRPDRPDFGFGGAWLDAGGQQVHLIEGTTPTVSTSPCWSTGSTRRSPTCETVAWR